MDACAGDACSSYMAHRPFQAPQCSVPGLQQRVHQTQHQHLERAGKKDPKSTIMRMMATKVGPNQTWGGW